MYLDVLNISFISEEFYEDSLGLDNLGRLAVLPKAKVVEQFQV